MVAFYCSSRKVARPTEGENTIHAGNRSRESTFTVYSKGIITPGGKLCAFGSDKLHQYKYEDLMGMCVCEPGYNLDL